MLPSDKMAEKLNLNGYTRHFLICVGPKCCQEDIGQRLWDYVKTRFAELKLSNTQLAPVVRSKVGCLRVCCDGPIAVIYPEGTWYRQLDENAIDEIIAQHLIGGQPVEKYRFAQSPVSKFENAALEIP